MISHKQTSAVRTCGVIMLLHYLCIIMLVLLISRDYAFPIINVRRRINSSPQPFTISRWIIPSSSSSPSLSSSYCRGCSSKDLLLFHHRSKPFILYARRQAPEISDQLELFEDYDDEDGDDDEYDEDGEGELPDMNDIKFHTNAVENNE